jgi:hypothetical protein
MEATRSLHRVYNKFEDSTPYNHPCLGLQNDVGEIPLSASIYQGSMGREILFSTLRPGY